MKILHAADLHLDSPLRGLARYEGAPLDRLRGATRQALQNLVELALAEPVACVLIAGDVYDGDWKDYGTGLFFSRQMARLREAGIPVVLIRGNHDAASQITRSLRLPDNVRELACDHPESYRLESLGLALHGQGFAKREVTEDLSSGYPAPVPGWLNIGLLHTSADGRPGHESYAPCSVVSLQSKGYDYWALGHVHQREVLSQDPWVVFPGNIQGRHIREPGAKGCSLIDVHDGRITGVEHRELDVLRWVELEVLVPESASRDDALEAIVSPLQSQLDLVEGRLLAVRLRLRGATRAHPALQAHLDQLVNDCRALFSQVGGDQVWLEQVRVETTLPGAGPVGEEFADAAGDLLRFVRQAATDDQLLDDLRGELKGLQNKLRSDLRDGPEPLDFDQRETLAGLLPDVEELLRQKLATTRRQGG